MSITSLFSFKSALNNNFEMSPNANNSETKRKQTNDHDHNYLYEIAYVLFLEFLQMIWKTNFQLNRWRLSPSLIGWISEANRFNGFADQFTTSSISSHGLRYESKWACYACFKLIKNKKFVRIFKWSHIKNTGPHGQADIYHSSDKSTKRL